MKVEKGGTIRISIHAPVKGATGEPGHLFVEAKFQSTHP